MTSKEKIILVLSGFGLLGYVLLCRWLGRRGERSLSGMYPEYVPPAPTIIREDQQLYPDLPTQAKKPSTKATCFVPKLPATSKLLQHAFMTKAKSKPSARLQSSQDAYEAVRDMGTLPQEDFMALLLNNKNEIIGTALVGRGTSTAVAVEPTDAMRAAVLSGAKRMLVVHNHPSGDPHPSSDDVAVTVRLQKIGELLGVPLLDHLIIGDQGFFSMRDRGNIR